MSKSEIANAIYDAAIADAPKQLRGVGRWLTDLADMDYFFAMCMFDKYFPGCDCGDALKFRYASENHQRTFMLFVANAEGAQP